ncbi:migration and invasion inhibitory protein, transcript variant X2 [Columba livia]|uniref:Migration and invasion inhibitory protein, transcript variant X1 n=1 Tax=Columba livia TaxID=8932 RepID=A0A2I0M2Z3_COLLI|nr:migration and invasion-inhibitory protein [Columba livia]PKK24051.1 migration and invasion inhibitory protein, transcript variant X1 [Columba livia]PKK24052.1 migration and invasion inhibitory protein, transcript variant X2 [Columba livia]
MESEHLKRLRQANQDLLQRLRMKQEEIRKRLPSRPLVPASLHNRAATERSVPVPKRGKENQDNAVNSTSEPAVLVSMEPRVYAARAALCSSLKYSSNDRGVQQRVKMQEGVALDSSFPGNEKNVTPVSAITMCGRETSGVDRDGHGQRSPEEESLCLGYGENRKQSTLLHGFHKKKQPEDHVDPSVSRIQSEETSKPHVVLKEPIICKSILLTSQSKELKREAGHVTFQPDPEEYTIPVSSWSACPFLGYDWIAGLLDTNSPVAEKSDQYFAELHEFRQANKEACINEQNLEPKALDYIDSEQEPDLISGSHKCVYCYRLNQRLFTVPVDSESACPVCKIPRSHQPPETLEEPAYVRVSIPTSTLMPAYKYKAHRRKSLEPVDNLALPSHCLAGWENVIPSSNPTLSSLDLRASLEENPSHHPHLNSVSGVSGGTRTDKLLNLTRLARFRFGSASQQREQSKPGRYRAAPNLNLTASTL